MTGLAAGGRCVEAAAKGLIVPILVGPEAKIRAAAKGAGRAIVFSGRDGSVLLQLDGVLFGPPLSGRDPLVKATATLGLALPIMANFAEIVRGAVQSIPTAQWEAARSLAFSRRQTLWKIILPQCVKRMLPPWMNWYAILTMATTLASIVGVNEMMTQTQRAPAFVGIVLLVIAIAGGAIVHPILFALAILAEIIATRYDASGGPLREKVAATAPAGES